MTAAYPQILLKGRHPDRILTLAEYRTQGGYQALAHVLDKQTPEQVKHRVSEALLLGRGGAAFPAGRKMETVPEDAPHPRYVICNADEMEPGTFKDRVLLHTSPHLLIEGMIIAAYAVSAGRGIIFIRPEYENAARILERELTIARDNNLLGDDILGSGYGFELSVHRSAGRYICGEVTAQINALMGRRPNPQQPPPYPTVAGLWGKPTLVQNVETFACIPSIMTQGADWFRQLALTDSGAGSKLFCISGRVNRPGVYELPLGIPLSEIIEEHAGGMRPGSRFKACLPGGASTGFLPAEHYHIPMDFDSLHKVGNRLGTGAIMVFDQTVCLVAATVNLMAFFARESCGWCTPCREGLPYLLTLLERIEAGEGRAEDPDIIATMCRQLYMSDCAFAPGAAAPVESLLTHFRDEVQAHISARRCPLATQAALGEVS
jgi:NADH-quinone oxidoreductase subunit F